MRLKILTDCINGLLLALAVGVFITLVCREDPWFLIVAYWCVTVIKSAVVVIKEALYYG